MIRLKILLDLLQYTCDFLWGWPLISAIVGTSVILTFLLHGIQFRYFFESWRIVCTRGAHHVRSYTTPLESFLALLNASIGNGSLAGMASAISLGGPGAAFWVFLLGIFTMALRFAEVYLSTRLSEKMPNGLIRGGPMIFLKQLPGGHFTPTLYALCTLFVAFGAGAGLQCSAITASSVRLFGISKFLIAGICVATVLIIVLGGAQRIIRASNALASLKVTLFFGATITVLIAHASHIIPTLSLIMTHALTPAALTGAIAGITLQQMLRYSFSRTISATEAGLGTAGVLYGAVHKPDPFESGVMSMASIVVSNHLVCFVLMVVLVATGAYQSSAEGTAMTCIAYETVFGTAGCAIVTILSILFGMGVLVAYAFIGRECWFFITGGRMTFFFNFLYALSAAAGALAPARHIWALVDLGNAGMVMLTLFGILLSLPLLRREVVMRTVV